MCGRHVVLVSVRPQDARVVVDTFGMGCEVRLAALGSCRAVSGNRLCLEFEASAGPGALGTAHAS